MQRRSCPRCGEGLEPLTVGGVSVDGCGGCGGVWFDHREMTTLAQTQAARLGDLEAHFRAASHVSAPPAGMRCPACGLPLRGFEFPHAPGIPLHGCVQCKGIWVDDGELQAIHDRLQALRAPAAPSDNPPPRATADARQKVRQASGYLTHVECPGCHQPNPTASAVCWACGACLPGGRAFLCPRCDQPLADRVDFGLLLNACNTCGGLWLDGGELPKLVRQSPGALRRLEQELGTIGSQAVTDLDRERRLICPACHVVIIGRRYAGDSGVFLNACAGCRGTWIDAGELTLVAEISAGS